MENIKFWDYETGAGDNYDRVKIELVFNENGRKKIDRFLKKNYPRLQFEGGVSALAYLNYYPETDDLECCSNLVDLCTSPYNLPIEDSMVDKRIFQKCLEIARNEIELRKGA